MEAGRNIFKTTKVLISRVKTMLHHGGDNYVLHHGDVLENDAARC